jgi:hypothetical protein
VALSVVLRRDRQRQITKMFSKLKLGGSLLTVNASEDRGGRLPRFAIRAASLYLFLLVLLHFLKPEFDPSWRMVSEYAIGRYGWLMIVAFLSLAASVAALVPALRVDARGRAGIAGLVFLTLAALGMVIAGVAVTDPITIAKDQVTTSGRFHGLGFILGGGYPLAIALICWSVSRNSRWRREQKHVIFATIAAWIGFLSFMISMAVMLPANGGEAGPDVLTGWPNRLMMVTYPAWVIVTARSAARVHRAGVPIGESRKVVSPIGRPETA